MLFFSFSLQKCYVRKLDNISWVILKLDDQVMIWPALTKTTLPLFKREIFDNFPLTGCSRFAIQTTVLLLLWVWDSLNHISKEKAFSRTWEKPAQNIWFWETITSSACFSTEREDPLFNDNREDEEDWKEKSRTNKKSEIEKAMVVQFANQFLDDLCANVNDAPICM